MSHEFVKIALATIVALYVADHFLPPSLLTGASAE